MFITLVTILIVVLLFGCWKKSARWIKSTTILFICEIEKFLLEYNLYYVDIIYIVIDKQPSHSKVVIPLSSFCPIDKPGALS